MPESPDVLRDRGLFVYDESAVDEIEREFDRVEVSGQTVDPLLKELVCLTAAEYSLIRWISYPSHLLPVQRPLQVVHADAVLGFLKANCNPMFCFEQIEGGDRLSLADITAFSSDVVKLGRAEVHAMPDLENVIGDLARAVDEIELRHRESPSPRARALGESGVLRLQGFLWAVKASLPERDLWRVMDEAHDAFDLNVSSEQRQAVPAS
jgi:hypothetical protein